MSKTDKTRPLRVRVEEHRVLYPRRTTSIYWPTDRHWLGELKCGCTTCSDQARRKQDARRERHQGRAEARDWQRTSNHPGGTQ